MGILRGMEIGAAFFAAAGLFAGCSDATGRKSARRGKSASTARRAYARCSTAPAA
ncbi:hypothetical protein [Treponema saccharophilum]|uniref:hypothetical protein n=1 Tax=Treponema saccharophilum TaxID=165 RepID=UPI00131F0C90|nr:hypothetical protein [Treponema saccharophilum]